MSPEERQAFVENKRELCRVMRERKRQEKAAQEIQRLLRSHGQVGSLVVREHQRRLRASMALESSSEKAATEDNADCTKVSIESSRYHFQFGIFTHIAKRCVQKKNFCPFSN